MIKDMVNKFRNFLGDTEEDEVIEQQEEFFENEEMEPLNMLDDRREAVENENIIRNVTVNKKIKRNDEEETMQNVIVYRPKSFNVEEITPILASIKEKQIVGFSLEKLKGNSHGQRILDCISGAASVLNAKLDKMSDYVYLCVPENIGYEINANKESHDVDNRSNSQSGFYDETLDY